MSTTLQKIDESETQALLATGSPKMAKRWMKLTAYGDYPHTQGIQCIDAVSAQAMVDHFRSFRGRLQRRFAGIPVYIGHPDDPQFQHQPGHQDTRAYAWVQDLEAREDSLWILLKWSERGLELLRNAHFKFFSPRWEMKPDGHGKFKPLRLLSVGLTNYPNIPGDAIANEQKRAHPVAIVASSEEAVDACEAFLRHHLHEGRILPNECSDWERRYRDNPQGAEHVLQNCQEKLHLRSYTAALNAIALPANAKQQMLHLVHQRMKDLSESYNDAWAAVRSSHPHLF